MALHTSGRDNVDVEAASERGVVVTNVKGVNAEQCADFALGLMLATVRQIVRGDRAMRAGKWVAETSSSQDISGATLGLVGLGQIGRAVLHRAAAFNMRLLVHTRTHDDVVAERYRARFVPLDALLEQADIVCLTASLTPETRHMMAEPQLRRMKKSAYLINIARGELVDEKVLYRALTEGWLAGAGLDVFESEPLFKSPLFALENVVVTPHMAGLTVSGKLAAALRAARNALDVLAGELPADALNPAALNSAARQRRKV